MLRKAWHFAALATGIAALSACTGTVKMKNISRDDVNKPGGEVSGVVVYMPALFWEISQTTIRTDGKNVIGWETEPPGPTKCTPVTLRRIVTKADYANPKLIYYDRAFLEAYTLTVGLTADGVLTQVNSQSTPDRGQTLSNLAGAAKAAAGVAVAGTQYPACNDGAAVTGYERYPIENLK